ncbi:unnamed protein product [Prunus brigantina]
MCITRREDLKMLSRFHCAFLSVYSLLGLLQNQILSNLLVKEQCFGHTSQKALNSEIFHVERKDPTKLNFGVPSSLSYV